MPDAHILHPIWCLLLLGACTGGAGGPGKDKDTDEGCEASTFYADADGDGYGDPGAPTEACEAPDATVEDATDCDDRDAAANPGAAEQCDADDVDEDCDGAADDADDDAEGRTRVYADADGDGYGADDAAEERCDPDGEGVTEGGDCDDTDAFINPGAREVCDDGDVDEDCDGGADDDDAEGANRGSDWYEDGDGDGYGGDAREGCDPRADEVEEGGDCDDEDGAVNPDAEEICADGVDQDCDGTAGGCGIGGALGTGDADAVLLGEGVDGALGRSAAAGQGEVWLPWPGRPGSAGGSGGAVRITGALSGTDDVAGHGLRSVGAADTDEVGYGLTCGGDLDGDGEDDLVLLAPTAVNSGKISGSAFVFTGPVSDGLDEDDAAAVRYGYDHGDYFGISTAMGDWDGDGQLDLFTAEDAGRVSGELGPIGAGRDVGNYGVEVGIDATDGDRVAAGDIDGDGLDEVAVGRWSQGEVYLYAGPDLGGYTDDDAIALLEGDYADTELGSALRLGADLDGDGYGDLVAGGPGDASDDGRVEVLFGPIAGWTDRPDVEVEGDGAERLGHAVSADGDVDGDGVVDLVVGAPAGEAGADGGGAAYVFAGIEDGSLTAEDALATVVGGSEQGEAGLSVAMTDLDGDGLSDLVLGGSNASGLDGAGVVWVFYGGSY